MENEKIARELVKIAKELSGSRGRVGGGMRKTMDKMMRGHSDLGGSINEMWGLLDYAEKEKADWEALSPKEKKDVQEARRLLAQVDGASSDLYSYLKTLAAKIDKIDKLLQYI
jgi:hypothetical protein